MKNESLKRNNFRVFCALPFFIFVFAICAPIAHADEVNFPPLETLVPPDKKLDPAWVKSLTDRGEPHVCSGNELKYIGMPIGGLFAGQMYIGGDGQLGNWDVFNDFVFTGWSGNYGPVPVKKPLEQAFSLTVDGKETPLDATAFSHLTFRGEYPMAFVTYQDAKQPVAVQLTAFSPFIPLNADDSSLPLTVLTYTLKNTSNRPITVALKGSLENFVLNRERGALNGTRVNKVITEGNLSFLEETVAPESAEATTEDHLLEDWSKPDFDGWKVEGTAFGSSPFHAKSLTPDQRKLGFDRLGNEVDGFVTPLLNASPLEGQNLVGKLTSAPFTIDRSHLYFWIRPEGVHHQHCGLNLVVDGNIVGSFRPYPFHVNNPSLQLQGIDVRLYAGKQASIQIVQDSKDLKSGITVGKVFLSDREEIFNPLTGKVETFADAEDNGSMGLALLDGPADITLGDQQVPASQKLVGALGRSVTLKPGESQNLTFLVAWYFPNLNHIPSVAKQGRWYSSKFNSAGDVVRYFVQNRDRLVTETKTWHDTWYDSTLPYWFLDRTMIPTDNLASSTNYRFKNGRWWAWEGVGACEGTCGHVYSYAQAVAYLFPELEHEQRENIDFGTSQHPEGWIEYRGENKGGLAFDAQACYILRALRESRLSPDNSFLTRNWPHVKLAMDWMIGWDGKESGILSGAQHNTLDADWYGEVSWLCGLYQAALRASSEMATTMGDPDYAAKCTRIADTGQAYMSKNLFNGEYYANKLDPAHPESINSGTGCEIDQVSGQAWADLLELPRVFPKAETNKSLESLWRYNYTPDVGPYRAVYKGGRRYADAGEAGVIMCTFPRNDWNFVQASGQGSRLFANYFNECMTGFEHQLGGLMIREGMVTEGLAIERSIDDRYAPAKRNPYNEVECGDHYGRAMAAYGVYLAACGFEYDGPAGKIGFAPRIHPENFRCAFTAAEGWGSYSQEIKDGVVTADLAVKSGKLSLQTINLYPGESPPSSVKVTLDGTSVPATLSVSGNQTVVKLSNQVVISEGQSLSITLSQAL